MCYYSNIDSLSLSLSLSEQITPRWLFARHDSILHRSSYLACVIFMIMATVPAFHCDAQWYCASQTAEETPLMKDCLNHETYFDHDDTARLGPCRVRLHIIRNSDGAMNQGCPVLDSSNLKVVLDDAHEIFLQARCGRTIHFTPVVLIR